MLAAASLAKTFDQLKHDFESSHDGVTIDIVYAGSSALAEQIVAGNNADVFASADEQTMATVTKAGDADGTPAIFATNTLTIATHRATRRTSPASPTSPGPASRSRSVPRRCRAARRRRRWRPRPGSGCIR